jgi:hypothetical protein
VTARSNWGLPFVCNKSAMGGWGLAEEHRQRAVRIAVIADIAVIARDRKTHRRGRRCHTSLDGRIPLNYTPIEAEPLKSTPNWDDLG